MTDGRILQRWSSHPPYLLTERDWGHLIWRDPLSLLLKGIRRKRPLTCGCDTSDGPVDVPSPMDTHAPHKSPSRVRFMGLQARDPNAQKIARSPRVEAVEALAWTRLVDFHLFKNIVLFSPVGFNRNGSLLFFFPGA